MGSETLSRIDHDKLGVSKELSLRRTCCTWVASHDSDMILALGTEGLREGQRLSCPSIAGALVGTEGGIRDQSVDLVLDVTACMRCRQAIAVVVLGQAENLVQITEPMTLQKNSATTECPEIPPSNLIAEIMIKITFWGLITPRNSFHQQSNHFTSDSGFGPQSTSWPQATSYI